MAATTPIIPRVIRTSARVNADLIELRYGVEKAFANENLTLQAQSPCAERILVTPPPRNYVIISVSY